MCVWVGLKQDSILLSLLYFGVYKFSRIFPIRDYGVPSHILYEFPSRTIHPGSRLCFCVPRAEIHPIVSIRRQTILSIQLDGPGGIFGIWLKLKCHQNAA